MTDFETLLVEQEGPILWVRLNRPEVLNAYTNQMGAELVRAIQRADGDDSIKVVVLTGTGRVFCAGADVSAGAGAFDTESGEGAKNFGSGSGTRENSNFVGAMMDSVKPLLVAFNGSAAGVGLTLTLPCDIRIAADNARFGCVFTRRGLVPEAGSAWFLPRLVG
ncbi:MAG: enoyl-CoA hydratase/isomerase family protein, partial [Novosphingobium sp.]|nr:enoyl-CoA hydratase/isomerase family protein [Novosphingobium sp.]